MDSTTRRPDDHADTQSDTAATPSRRRRVRGKSKPALFREKDLARAMKVATEQGLQIGSVRIEPDGAIVLHTATGAPISKDRGGWDR